MVAQIFFTALAFVLDLRSRKLCPTFTLILCKLSTQKFPKITTKGFHMKTVAIYRVMASAANGSMR